MVACLACMIHPAMAQDEAGYEEEVPQEEIVLSPATRDYLSNQVETYVMSIQNLLESIDGAQEPQLKGIKRYVSAHDMKWTSFYEAEKDLLASDDELLAQVTIYQEIRQKTTEVLEAREKALQQMTDFVNAERIIAQHVKVYEKLYKDAFSYSLAEQLAPELEKVKAKDLLLMEDLNAQYEAAHQAVKNNIILTARWEKLDSHFIAIRSNSQQIQQLEGEIGAQLFERTKHSVILTEAGEELLPLALKTIEDSEVCANRMRDLKGALVGTLRIGTTQSFSALLTDTVRRFITEHPGVKLEILSAAATDLIEMLRDKELDLVLAFKPSMAYDEIESEPLFKNNLSAVMRKDHPLASRTVLTMEDLENRRLVLPGKGLQARRAFDRYLGLDTRKLNVTVEVNDPNLIMDIVQSTNLISVVSSLASYYRSNLVAIPLEGGHYSMEGCIHRHKEGYRKRSAEIFVDMLRDSAQIERISKGLEK